jgi:hypothetical protein
MGRHEIWVRPHQTDDQTTTLQLAALKRARCSHIYKDKGLAGGHANEAGPLVASGRRAMTR